MVDALLLHGIAVDCLSFPVQRLSSLIRHQGLEKASGTIALLLGGVRRQTVRYKYVAFGG